MNTPFPMPVVTWPDPVLTEKAAEITEITQEIRDLAQEMIRTMRHENGIGLAAPQVGKSIRLIVMDDRLIDGLAMDPIIMVNPKLVRYAKKGEVATEGCLSLPGAEYTFPRLLHPSVRYQTLEGRFVTTAFNNWAARCVQHEMDHLVGILICDK